MPSVRYLNQSAPFWDFVANLEEQGASHPFFADRRQRGGPPPFAGPFGWGHPGPRGGWFQGPRNDDEGGPSTPREHKTQETDDTSSDDDVTLKTPNTEVEAEAEAAQEKGQNNNEKPRCEGPRRHHNGGCPGRRGGPHAYGRGPWRGPFGFPFNFANMGEYFDGNDANRGSGSQEFKPEADIFDTAEAYLIHLSLPGANKEDVGVNWDPEKSELVVSGVVHRPDVDEELLKHLSLDERKVGMFERKIRLGSRVNPALVDADAISAKMENGVLRIEVPKMDKDYVEVKKVDVQ